MTLPPVLVFDPTAHGHLIHAFAEILIDCVETDHTLANFLPPFDHTNPKVPDGRVIEYWKKMAAQVVEGSRIILMQLSPCDGEMELAGYVSLFIPTTESEPFRGSVEKLLISPRYRQRGIARRLMVKLEEVAQAKGTTLLCLDTEVGSPAEMVYPRLGYTRVGAIPGYGISPRDGRLVDEVFFYKNLRET